MQTLNSYEMKDVEDEFEIRELTDEEIQIVSGASATYWRNPVG